VQILNAIFEVVVPELAARGGVVDRFHGGSVKVVFQGPDHVVNALDACVAARACLEAVAARAGAESPYARGVTMGVATGELLAAGVGSKAAGRLDYMVLGEAVDAAEHLTRAAAQGQILVDSTVADTAGDLFAFEEAGTREIPGCSAPAAVYSVAGRARRAPHHLAGTTGIRSSDAASITSTLDAGPRPSQRKRTAPS
jgi:class 3 adenylate cyclase